MAILGKFFQISAFPCSFGRRFASSKFGRTCLYDFHKSLGGKIVDFAGWEMPVQYADMSIAQSTVHTRSHVSVFDVSHMMQTKIYGNDRIAFMESLVPADIEGLENDHGTLSVFTNSEGGIKDDLIVTKTSGDHLYLVTNAGCIDNDWKHLEDNCKLWQKDGKDVRMEHFPNGLVAVQGPEMMKLIQPGLDFDLSKLYFMHSVIGTVFGIANCRITRCGYTGEDGVEISIDPKAAPELCDKLLKSNDGQAKMAGLGARDALRLESGLCLYGNDIDETTTPIEAGLTFVIAKKRRQTGGFPGSDTIISQIKNKNPRQKRIGLITETGRPARAGATLHDPNSGEKVGRVTSGCPSPCLKKNIAHGYVEPKLAKSKTELAVDITGKSGKLTPIIVTKMPFLPTHYYTGK